jgi:Flp pilus assembly protein TadD
MYTLSLGFVLGVSVGGYLIYQKFKGQRIASRALLGLGMLIVLAFSVISFARNPVWKDDLTLFSTDIQTYPNSVRLNMNYAKELIDKNTSSKPVPMNADLEEAKASIDRVISLIPDLALTHILYGNLHKVTGQYEAAEAQYLKAQDLDPNNPVVYFNLGLTAQIREDLALAKTHYLKSLELYPNHHGALSNLGVIYGRQNELDKCIDVLEKAFKLKPDATGAGNLEQAYSIKGNAVKAHYYRDLKTRIK